MEKRELTKQEHENIALHIKAALIQIEAIEQIAGREEDGAFNGAPNGALDCIEARFRILSLASKMRRAYLSAVGSPYDRLDTEYCLPQLEDGTSRPIEWTSVATEGK